MVITSAAAQITAINSNVYTVSSFPSTMLVGTSCDFCGDQPPFNLLAEAQAITNISGTDLTFTAAITGVAVGDWIALNGQTPVPQIPVEYRLLLAQRVVCKIYELQGYLQKLQAAQMKLKEYEDATITLITPRIKSQTKIINPINGGFLAGNQNKLTNFPAGKDG